MSILSTFDEVYVPSLTTLLIITITVVIVRNLWTVRGLRRH